MPTGVATHLREDIFAVITTSNYEQTQESEKVPIPTKTYGTPLTGSTSRFNLCICDLKDTSS